MTGINFIQLNKVKASGGCLRFSEVVFRATRKKSGPKYAKAYLIISCRLIRLAIKENVGEQHWKSV